MICTSKIAFNSESSTLLLMFLTKSVLEGCPTTVEPLECPWPMGTPPRRPEFPWPPSPSNSMPPPLLNRSKSSRSSKLLFWASCPNSVVTPENMLSSGGRRFPIVFASSSSRDPKGSSSSLEEVMVLAGWWEWMSFPENLTAKYAH